MIEGPQISLSKSATLSHRFRRSFYAFPSARSGIGAYLRSLNVRSGHRILLPAYVGWSPREGSGVLDPIREAQLDVDFYRVDGRLRIDVQHLQSVLATGNIGVVLLIHYFGRPDPSVGEVVQLARESGVIIVEDEAHAMFTDLVGGISGRHSDAAVYALHKMLPLREGGTLVINQERHQQEASWPRESRASGFDLAGIAAQRCANYAAWERQLAPLTRHLEPLWNCLEAGVVPQTFPVIVHSADRDQLYHRLNDSGIGVVSLYHTMDRDVPGIDAFSDAHSLTRRIMNLPVHQDVDPDQIEAASPVLTQAVAASAGAER
jgi:dTDP-4-amino-4,6-dideoxygalactose transaminase